MTGPVTRCLAQWRAIAVVRMAVRRTVWLARLAPVVLTCSALGCGSSSVNPAAPTPAATPQPLVVPELGNRVLEQMLSDLPAHIAASLRSNQQSLYANPGAVAARQAKIALLQRPTIAHEIVAGRWFDARNTPSMKGTVMMATVFLQEGMRTEATTALEQLGAALPVLEAFIRTAFPHEALRVWYGFAVGSQGGGGTILAEDRRSYESRTEPSRPAPEAILFHELAHSYIRHEGLTQFLELYVINVLATNSQDPAVWTHARHDVGSPPASTASSDALLEIYRLIGPDAMSRAYGTLQELNVPYGAALPTEGKQALIAEAPPELRHRVTELTERIVY